MKFFLFAVGLILAFLASPTKADASIVGEDIGGIIEILQPDPGMKPGLLYYSIDNKRVRKSVIRIISVENGKVSGRVLKGTAVPGQQLVLHSKSQPPAAESPQVDGSPFKIAYRGTLGVSVFTLGGISGAGSNVGLALGGNVDFQKGAMIFGTGLQYYQAGMKIDEESVYKVKVVLDYLGLPVVAKYAFGNPYSDSSFRLKGGFMVSTLLSAKYEAEVLGNQVAGPVSINDKTDYLALFGMEYVARSNGKEYIFDFTYNYGLKSYGSRDEAIRNMGFFALFGLGF